MSKRQKKPAFKVSKKEEAQLNNIEKQWKEHEAHEELQTEVKASLKAPEQDVDKVDEPDQAPAV